MTRSIAFQPCKLTDFQKIYAFVLRYNVGTKIIWELAKITVEVVHFDGPIRS